MKQYDTKLTNPKDHFGSAKLPLGLVPSTMRMFASLAFLEGALKYGRFNWRIAGVRVSIYTDAMERHIEKFKNGEWADSVTKVPHLASVLACAGIILDAAVCGKLTDDRAPEAPVSELIDRMADSVAHLKEVFKGHDPQQYTIEDSPDGYERIDGRILPEVSRVTPSEEGTSGAKQSKARSREGRKGPQGRR